MLVPHEGSEVASDARGAADQLMREIAESVALLPALPPPDPDDRYHARNLTTLWLMGVGSDRNRKGYFRDLGSWLSWCDQHNVDPFAARRADADAWVHGMTAVKIGKGGVVTHVQASNATVTRRIAVVSSWYKYMQSNDIATGNPAAAVKRPPLPEESPLPALAADETALFLDWLVERAERLGTEAAWREAAQLTLLFHTGLRVTASCEAKFENIGFEQGYCILRYQKKARGKAPVWDWVPLTPEVLSVQTRYWEVRAKREQVAVDELSGHLFVSTPHPQQPERAGGRSLNQKHVERRLKTLARQAGVKAWKTITPHSARSTAITLVLEDGATLAQAQDLAGHADPRTTRRYDKRRHKLKTSAVWTLSAVLAQEHQRQSGQRPNARVPAAGPGRGGS